MFNACLAIVGVIGFVAGSIGFYVKVCQPPNAEILFRRGRAIAWVFVGGDLSLIAYSSFTGGL